MLESIQRQCFTAAPVNAHQPFDEHLCEVIEYTGVLQFDQGRSQCVPLRRSHLLHTSGIQALRFKRELPQLYFGKQGIDGDGMIFARQPLLPVEKLP